MAGSTFSPMSPSGSSSASSSDNQEDDPEGLLLEQVVQNIEEVVDEESDSDDPAINNILHRKRNAKNRKEKNALSHFNDFLEKHWPKLRPDQAIPSGPKHDLITLEDMDFELFGCFANYLVNANNKNDSRNGYTTPLSLNTALGYFSAVKMHYKSRDDYRRAALPPRIFDHDNWKELSTKMTSEIVERHKKDGTPLVNPKASANTDDWKALASVCVWIGEQKFLEFWCVFVALVHLAARVNEAAFLQFSHLTTVLFTGAQNFKNRVAHLKVNNYKQGSMQQMHVFPHIDLWQLDYYFSHAVFFACSDNSSDYIYPTFGARATQESSTNNNKDSSKIVKHFTDCLKKCLQWFEINKASMEEDLDVPHNLTKGICSHSGKKYAVREMGRELNPIYVIFRAGWAVRNAHTLFDYLVRDVVHDIKAAKIVAGWTTAWHGDIWGGRNNSIDDLTIEKDKFVPFCEALFQFQKDKLDYDFMLLLGFSVLRFFDDFQRCIQSHPTSPNSLETHPFIVQVTDSLDRVGVQHATFVTWQEDIQRAFTQHNALAVSLQMAPNNMTVDTRPLLDRLQLMENNLFVYGMACTHMQVSLGKLAHLTTEVNERLKRMEELIENMRGATPPMFPPPPLRENTEHAEEGSPGEQLVLDENTAPRPFRAQSYYTTKCYDHVLQDRYGNRPIPLQKLFATWFLEQLPITYENYKKARQKTQATKEGEIRRLDPKHHKKTKTHFSLTKTAIHVMLKNLDEYPSEGMGAADLEALGNQAIDNIMKKHKIKRRPTRSSLADGSGAIFKKGGENGEGGYMKVPFPPNTPMEIQEWFHNRGIHNNKVDSTVDPAEGGGLVSRYVM